MTLQIVGVSLFLLLCSFPVDAKRVGNRENKAEVSDSEPDSESARSLLQETSNTSSAEQNDALLGFEPKCPMPITKDNHVPNAIHIEMIHAHNLPYHALYTVDPYVRFWVGPEGKYNGVTSVKDNEKTWLGKSPAINNARDPVWNYGCTFFYENAVDEKSMFNVVVMSKDSRSADDFVGQVMKEDGQKGVTMQNILAQDTLNQENDGAFEVTLKLYTKKGKPITGSSAGDGKVQSNITMRFTVLRDTSKYTLKSTTGLLK